MAADPATLSDSAGPAAVPPGGPGDPGGMLRAGAVVSSMTMLSRVTGLARDVAIAAALGASMHADAFFIAFRLPQFLRRLFAEGAFTQSFVPVLSEYRARRGPAEVKALVDRTCGALSLALFAVSVVGVLAAPALTALFASGFLLDAAKFSLASDMLRITFPYLMLISLTAFAAAVQNVHGRFALPAATPILLNLSLICAVAVGARWLDEPVFALAWAVLFAGFAQLAAQLPALASLRMLPRPRIDARDPGVRRVLSLMLPMLFGVSANQINLLVDTAIASFLPTGSIAWLYYSDKVMELPLGVFGAAVATVLLPGLSRSFAGDSAQAFRDGLDWGVRTMLLVGAPATAGLIALAEPIAFTLFQHGAMQPDDARRIALGIRCFAAGLPALLLVRALAPGYFARQDTRTPVRVGVIALASNVVFNLLLAVPLHFWFDAGYLGLATATTLSAWLNAALLARGLSRDGQLRWRDGLVASIARVLAATAAMSAGLAAALWRLPDWSGFGPLERVAATAACCALGGLLYCVALYALGARTRHYGAPSP